MFGYLKIMFDKVLEYLDLYKIMYIFDSYPHVYPQINLTDSISKHSRSGVKWRIVVDSALLKRAFVTAFLAKPHIPYICQTPYTMFGDICQTFVILFGHYTV